MFTLPSPLPTDKRQLQDLATAAINDLKPSCGGDFIQAERTARIQYPALFLAIKNADFPAPDQTTPLGNLAAITQPGQVISALALNGKPTMPECDACWKAMGNKANPDRAPEAFEALCDLAMKSSNLSYSEAKSAVAVRHPSLALKKDTVLAARKLSAPLPSASQGSDTRQNTLANDMDNQGVRQTYCDAMAKHMRENPECPPLEAHTAVMKSHPALAKAMRKKRSDADTNADTDTTTGALANSATVLANSADLPTKLIDMTKPFLARTVNGQWA